MNFIRINENFEISEGSDYELIDRYACKITSKGVLNALKDGAVACAFAKGAEAYARTDGSIAIAHTEGAIAKSRAKGAIAEAWVKGSVAEAWADGAMAKAMADGSLAQACTSGAVARAYSNNATVVHFKQSNSEETMSNSILTSETESKEATSTLATWIDSEVEAFRKLRKERLKTIILLSRLSEIVSDEAVLSEIGVLVNELSDKIVGEST